MGRLAQGPMTMRLLPGEQLAAAMVPETPSVVIISLQGQISRIDLSTLRQSQRGDLGTMVVQLNDDADRIAGVSAAEGLIGVRSSEQRNGRIDSSILEDLPTGQPFNDQLNLKTNETIIEITRSIEN